MKKRLIAALLAAFICCALCPGASAAEPKLLALTFDDGPSAKYTPALLDGLDERGVRVTFFVMGNSLADSGGNIVQANAEIVRRAAGSGHQIASHSYSHPYFSQLSDAEITAEISRTNAALTEILGAGDYMVRLPYGDGAGSSRVCSLVNAPIILWSVDPTGGVYPASEEKLYSGIINSVTDGSIILLHDFHGMANVNAALRAIDTLRGEGYEFVTVQELFRLKGVTPQAGKIYRSVSGTISVFYDESALESHWAWEDISYVRERGLMQGDGEGFKPNAHLTRAMAAAVLWRASGSPEPLPEEHGFTDVISDAWYSEAVAWCTQQGLVTGYGDGRFGPNDELSREQLYTLGARLAGLSGGEGPELYSDDDRISVWARDAVFSLRDVGFTSENDVELFRPQAGATRAECAELLHFLLENTGVQTNM